jgi:hypothetical protein
MFNKKWMLFIAVLIGFEANACQPSRLSIEDYYRGANAIFVAQVLSQRRVCYSAEDHSTVIECAPGANIWSMTNELQINVLAKIKGDIIPERIVIILRQCGGLFNSSWREDKAALVFVRVLPSGLIVADTISEEAAYYPFMLKKTKQLEREGDPLEIIVLDVKK